MAELNEKIGVVLADRRQGRMVRRQAFVKDREGACKQRLGLGGAVGSPVEHSEVVEPAGEVGVLGAERLLVDRDGTLEEWLGRLVAAGGLIERSQLVERGGQPRMVGPVDLLVDGDGALKKQLGHAVAVGGRVQRGYRAGREMGPALGDGRALADVAHRRERGRSCAEEHPNGKAADCTLACAQHHAASLRITFHEKPLGTPVGPRRAAVAG